MAMAIVEKTGVGSAKRSNEQIAGAIAVDIREDRGAGGLVRAANPQGAGHILEFPIPQIAKKAAASFQIAEEQITVPVAIEVPCRQTRAIKQILILDGSVVGKMIREINPRLIGRKQSEAGPSGLGHCEFGDAIVRA